MNGRRLKDRKRVYLAGLAQGGHKFRVIMGAQVLEVNADLIGTNTPQQETAGDDDGKM